MGLLRLRLGDRDASPQALTGPTDTGHLGGKPVRGEGRGEAWPHCLSLVGVRGLSILFLQYHLIKTVKTDTCSLNRRSKVLLHGPLIAFQVQTLTSPLPPAL